eukprot:2082575-Karenia_brevis.AAC.1
MQGKVLGERAAQEPAGHECFCWHLMGAHLEIIGDPDWRLMCQAKYSMIIGVRVGPDYKMPRKPALFKRKMRWRRYGDMDDEVDPESKSIYVSAVDHVSGVEAMFEEDVRMGHMRKLTNLEAEAIAALQKDEDLFRIIHDGTHKVRVNPQIIVRDQIAYPAVGEKTAVLTRAARMRSTMLGSKADVSKAHRRVR